MLLSIMRKFHQQFLHFISVEEAAVTDLRITQMNGSVRFVCQYRGFPQPQLVWQVNSRPIRNEEILGRIDEGGENSFQSTIFTNRTLAEKYVFKCIVSNPFGVDSSEATLLRSGTPSPVSAGTAVVTCFSLYVVSAILSSFFQ